MIPSLSVIYSVAYLDNGASHWCHGGTLGSYWVTTPQELGNRTTNLVTAILNLRTETEIKPCKVMNLRIFQKNIPESIPSVRVRDYLLRDYFWRLWVSEELLNNVTSLGTGQKYEGRGVVGSEYLKICWLENTWLTTKRRLQITVIGPTAIKHDMFWLQNQTKSSLCIKLYYYTIFLVLGNECRLFSWTAVVEPCNYQLQGLREPLQSYNISMNFSCWIFNIPWDMVVILPSWISAGFLLDRQARI